MININIWNLPPLLLKTTHTNLKTGFRFEILKHNLSFDEGHTFRWSLSDIEYSKIFWLSQVSKILVILLSLGTNYWHLHILCFCVFVDMKFLSKISICLKFECLDLEWDFLLLIFNSALNSLPIYRLAVDKRESFVSNSLFLMQ